MHISTTPAITTVAALAACLSWLAPVTQAQAAEQRFNFTSEHQPGATTVRWNQASGAPLYSDARGFGFIDQTGAQPARTAHTAQIRSDGKGFFISEPLFTAERGFEALHYNRFGMTFRIKAAPGAYAIRVRTTSSAADTTVSVSGMQTSRLLANVFWDAAELMPNRTRAFADGREWSYRYVNGQQFIDIEIEPNQPDTAVGVEEIVLTPIAPSPRPPGVPPAIFTLGDSTVKSYTFDEAPMSGWGQVFDQLFDPARVRVLNYSMGGRSFRSAYSEGRLNDLLLAGHVGDAVLIQFGHNDESEDTTRRFGRGATEAMYEAMLTQVYLPAIRARGMVPVLVTPMSRVNGQMKPGEAYVNSFSKRRFPDLLKQVAAREKVTLVDLNALSVAYYNHSGVEAMTAMVMSIEAGETPGKTNDGSFANGHPSNKIDGTHFKEALSKQYARMVATELARLGKAGDPVAAGVASKMKPAVRDAIASGNWAPLQRELANDIVDGDGAYYRNQIEKLLQLGAMHKDAQGNVNPAAAMGTHEFIGALCRLMGIPAAALAGYGDGPLSRAAMGAILADAYHARFTERPRYMTAYNGKTVLPGSPGYDPNLDSGAQGAMYYPLLRWEQLSDTGAVPAQYAGKLKDAYELGLIRSEVGIARGRMLNGRILAPEALVTRAKAAKALYFMWVLAQPPKAENDTISKD